MNIGITEGIIIALIGGLCGIAGQIISAHSARKKKQKEDEHKENQKLAQEQTEKALMQKQLSSIEKKLDQHNHYAERFEEIEKAIVRIDTKLEALKETIKNGN